ncbi:alginate O-acetyltransferase AlgX-related protein [Azospirillum brasilense]|uniref:alginate O-acetyltransferase AlgX-related protein n=1 Tax=Azospirillum brasilense TaxID=192 RepID=UPI00157B7453
MTGGPVQERPLAYAGLFSSAAATTTLFRAEDFQPWRADHRLLEERRASLHAIQDAVEANGVTRFLLLVAPDKGTVYADFLLEPPPHRSAGDEVLGADPTLQAGPLAAGLTALAAGGVRDVYAPNGSRWGLEGQLYAARTVARTLGRLGVLTGAADASPDVAILPCRPGQGDCTPTRTQTD